MLSALNFAVAQVVAFLPAAMDQGVAKLSHIVNLTRAFLRAGVKPHARPWFDASPRDVIHNPALVPPHRRRQRGDPAEYLAVLQAQINRQQPTERRTGNAGICCAGKDSKL